MGILLEDIKNYFNNTPKDILEKDWKDKEYLDGIGPDFMECVDYVREHFGIDIMNQKQPNYPKTYEECCKVLAYEPSEQVIAGYKAELIEDFRKLLLCRDAYWKIAGEQMGLDKPWKPDWHNTVKYCIESVDGSIDYRAFNDILNCILAFPTEEMRDAFYENFKELIEQCKELL